MGQAEAQRLRGFVKLDLDELEDKRLDWEFHVEQKNENGCESRIESLMKHRGKMLFEAMEIVENEAETLFNE